MNNSYEDDYKEIGRQMQEEYLGGFTIPLNKVRYNSGRYPYKNKEEHENFIKEYHRDKLIEIISHSSSSKEDLERNLRKAGYLDE